MFLLNSTSVDAGAIIGARFLTRAQNIRFSWFRSSLFLLITSFYLFLVRYKHASENARYLGVFVCGSVLQAFDVEVLGIDFYTFAFVLVNKLYSSFIT